MKRTILMTMALLATAAGYAQAQKGDALKTDVLPAQRTEVIATEVYATTADAVQPITNSNIVVAQEQQPQKNMSDYRKDIPAEKQQVQQEVNKAAAKPAEGNRPAR